MAKRKKDSKLPNPFEHLEPGTTKAILSVVFFVVAILLLLAPLGKAGLIGTSLFKGLSYVAGIGYFLFPVVFLSLGIALLKKSERSMAISNTIGAVLFFVAGLGLIEIAFEHRGGVLGILVSNPLIKLFDTAATAVMLIGVVIISTFLMFDSAAHVKFALSFVGKIFKRKDRSLDNAGEAGEAGDDSDEDDEDAPVKIANPQAMATRKLDAEEDDGGDSDEDEVKIAPAALERRDAAKDVFRGASLFRFSSGRQYVPPPLSLLENDKGKPGVGDIKANSNIIKRTLQNFGIDVEMDEVSIGPSVTRYSLKPAEGVKLSRILTLGNDLSLALAAYPIRIEAPIPGKSLVGIEIPNSVKTTVGLGTLLGNDDFSNSEKPLFVALGKSVSGISHYTNFAKAPHMLIAGATGSGKSVTIHALITSLLYRNSPESLKFVMIDPKRVELTLYNGIPHLLTPVITDAKKAILSLKWAAKEMDRRYDVLESKKVRDIDSYHKNILEPALARLGKKGATKPIDDSDDDENDSDNALDNAPETMPYIVIIIDELADIMQAYPRELEAAIVRLAQMSRAVGIHLMLSTQRPSVNVITGLIKANIPTRIALQVASQIDSRTILDMAGAEKLLGAGDMLFMSADMGKPSRLQSAFITEREVKNVVDYLKENYADDLQEIDITADVKAGGERDPMFDSLDGDGADEDDLYEEAREIVMKAGKASTSYLQRKLRIGYARAARLIDMLEERGVVSGGSGAKPRDVLVGGASDLDGGDGVAPEGFGEQDSQI